MTEYKFDFNWQKTFQILNTNDENVAVFSFYREENDFIFRFDDFTIDDHVYQSRRLCILHLVVTNILQLIHDDDHSDYVKCFEQIFAFWYIRNLNRYLRDYLKHCSQCQMYQIRRHVSYEFMQFILTFSISFYIIIMNFILTLFISSKDFDIIMFVICKLLWMLFSQR